MDERKRAGHEEQRAHDLATHRRRHGLSIDRGIMFIVFLVQVDLGCGRLGLTTRRQRYRGATRESDLILQV